MLLDAVRCNPLRYMSTGQCSPKKKAAALISRR